MKGGDASRPHQLPLGLRHAPAMTRADFLTGDANREAIALIDRWPDWPARVVVISGPPGSGKSHLVEIWRSASDAAVTAANAVDQDTVAEFVAAGAAAVEDLQVGPLDEAALFHLINLARERDARLLFTSGTPPGALPIALPDLGSRLRTAHLVTLGRPDEVLLHRVLVKLFTDRQLAVEANVVDYIVTRMERSFAAASAIVDALDRAALAEGKPITRPLASAVLGDPAVASGEAAPK